MPTTHPGPETPAIVGVGQSVDRIDRATYRRWSAVELAAEAARAALADAGLPQHAFGGIDAIVTTRTFEDMVARTPPFGRSTNFPRSVAARLGIRPRRAFWTRAGGNSPQDLVSEFCGRIAAGEFGMVLICGGEAISTVRHALRTGHQIDFTDTPAGEVEDRGSGIEDYRDPLAQRHGVVSAPIGYGLAENARRTRLGQSREDYAETMGRLFEPFARIAQENPYAAWAAPAYAAQELATASPDNRWIADPYPLRLVARDQVNLGAAILISSHGAALALGVAPDRMVYLHGHARATEKSLLARPDIGVSPAAQVATSTALQRAGIEVDAIAAFDLYSCFPIAVFNVADALGLAADDPRELTVTGGLPFFGGPGNNYSMHAIAAMVGRIRRTRRGAGLVGANGGYLSKYSVGIYSTAPREWRRWSDDELQERLDVVPPVATADVFAGSGVVETYSIAYDRGDATYAVVICRSADGARFIARSRAGDRATVAATQAEEPIGRTVTVEAGPDGINTFTFARSRA